MRNPEKKPSRRKLIAIVALVLLGPATVFTALDAVTSRHETGSKASAATSAADPTTVNVPMKVGDGFKIVRTSGAATATSSVYVTQNGLVQQGEPAIAIQGEPTTDALAGAASLAAQYYGMSTSSLLQDSVKANNAALAAAKLGDKDDAITCIGALGSLMSDAGVVTRHSNILAATFTNGNVDKACHYDTGYDAGHNQLDAPFDPSIGK